MFQTSTPVTFPVFVNRSVELRAVADIVARLKKGTPSWLAIFGPRKIGKTSLLLESATRCADPHVIFVVLDSYEEAPISTAIFLRYALRVLDGFFATEIGASLEAAAQRPAEFRALLQTSARFSKLAPALRSWILELPALAPDPRHVALCLDLPERLAQALSAHVVIAWDEFQELSQLDHEKVYAVARSLWQKHKRTTYVVSGSARAMLRSLVSAEHSPFFQHFSVLELGPFSSADAIELLARSGRGEITIPKAIAERAAAVLGGYPFYLQLLGQALEAARSSSTVHRARRFRVDQALFKEAVQDLLFSRTGRLSLYFEARYQDLVGRSTYLAAILQALADGPMRLSDLARAVGAPTGATVRYLERLADAIQKNADGAYRLDDPTFGRWLAWRKPGGTVIPMKLVGDEAELTCAKELSRMGFDLVYQSRSSHGAFDLLATRERAQLGVQVKRTEPPLAFSKAEWNRMVAEGNRFGWSWVVASVSRDDAVVFLEPGQRSASRSTTGVHLGKAAAIDNLLLWLERAQRKSKRPGK